MCPANRGVGPKTAASALHEVIGAARQALVIRPFLETCSRCVDSMKKKQTCDFNEVVESIHFENLHGESEVMQKLPSQLFIEMVSSYARVERGKMKTEEEDEAAPHAISQLKALFSCVDICPNSTLFGDKKLKEHTIWFEKMLNHTELDLDSVSDLQAARANLLADKKWDILKKKKQ